MNLLTFEVDSSQDMLRTIIIDDEAHMRETLRTLLSRYCPQVQVVGEAFGVVSGLATITELHPQLVLLDIKMDDGTGFDLLKQLETIDFKVIFITAFEKYAIQAFKFAAVDFLLKPVNPEELADAVRLAENLTKNQVNTQLQVLEENLKTDIQQKRKIILKTQENLYLIDLCSITYCESDGCYTRVHTTENEHILVSRTLREFDDMFSESGFYRIHKSYLVNMVQARRFEKQEGGYIVLKNGSKIPVASRKREELLELLEKLAG